MEKAYFMSLSVIESSNESGRGYALKKTVTRVKDLKYLSCYRLSTDQSKNAF